jgi:YggT family protein
MSSIDQALLFLVKNILQMYIFIILLRFLLQVAKADFYNPISQFIVKATAPILNPLRRIIPGLAGLDMAALVFALIVQVILIVLVYLIAFGHLVSPQTLLIGSFFGVFNHILSIFLYGIIISAILSWIPSTQGHPIAQLLFQLVEPALAPVRKILPDMGGIDISPIVVILAFQVIKILITPLLVV